MALEGVRVQRHAPAALYPRERPGTYFTGGWVGPRAGLDRCGKSRPTGIRSQDRPARSQSLYRLRYPVHPMLMRYEKLQGACLENKFVTEIRLVTCQLMLSASKHHAAQFLTSLMCHVKSVSVQYPLSAQKQNSSATYLTNQQLSTYALSLR